LKKVLLNSLAKAGRDMVRAACVARAKRDARPARSGPGSLATLPSIARSISTALSEYALAQAYIDLVVLPPERPPTVSGARVSWRARLYRAIAQRAAGAASRGGDKRRAREDVPRCAMQLPELYDALGWSIEQARHAVRSKATRREDPPILWLGSATWGQRPSSPNRSLRKSPRPRPKTDDGEDAPIEYEHRSARRRRHRALPLADRRTILAVATVWASHHGGISTLNPRALQLRSLHLGTPLMCLVPNASDADILNAKTARVELVRCPDSVQMTGTRASFVRGGTPRRQTGSADRSRSYHRASRARFGHLVRC